MEPKPRGIIPSDLDPMNWLVKAAEGYNKVTGNSYTETSFFRGGTSIEILDRILPELDHDPNILIVGLGLVIDPLICCYEPFRVSAHLEGRGINYAMTLVDVDEDVINDVKGRTRLFLAYRGYEGDLRTSFEKEWRKYLDDTNQAGTETDERMEGLKFCSYLEQDNGWISYENYLEKGVLVADVSHQFRAKLANGDIRLVHDDIAVADLSASGHFDYVECTNVLYLMTVEGQQLALANIARSMAEGGRLLINDIGGYSGIPVFPKFGGWLEEEKLRQLGFKVEELMYVEKYSQSALIRKI